MYNGLDPTHITLGSILLNHLIVPNDETGIFVTTDKITNIAIC